MPLEEPLDESLESCDMECRCEMSCMAGGGGGDAAEAEEASADSATSIMLSSAMTSLLQGDRAKGEEEADADTNESGSRRRETDVMRKFDSRVTGQESQDVELNKL